MKMQSNAGVVCSPYGLLIDKVKDRARFLSWTKFFIAKKNSEEISPIISILMVSNENYLLATLPERLHIPVSQAYDHSLTTTSLNSQTRRDVFHFLKTLDDYANLIIFSDDKMFETYFAIILSF